MTKPEEMRWISVDERLPQEEDCVVVLVWTGSQYGVHVGRFLPHLGETKFDGKLWFDVPGEYYKENVRYWMPLPEPPQLLNSRMSSL